MGDGTQAVGAGLGLKRAFGAGKPDAVAGGAGYGAPFLTHAAKLPTPETGPETGLEKGPASK